MSTVKCHNSKCCSVLPYTNNSRKYCSLSCSTVHKNEQIRIKNIEKYDQSPSQCHKCNKILDYDDRRNKYCSQSCAASLNNTLRVKPTTKKPASSKLIKVASTKSIKVAKPKLDREKRFCEGLIRERSALRKWLSKTVGYHCSLCYVSTWQDKPITLIVDHVDGNAGNNLPSNLRLLCPNCNSQTPTFGARNKGYGRKARGLPLR